MFENRQIWSHNSEMSSVCQIVSSKVQKIFKRTKYYQCNQKTIEKTNTLGLGSCQFLQKKKEYQEFDSMLSIYLEYISKPG